MHENDRNILMYMLTHEPARELFVAIFRATHDVWAGLNAAVTCKSHEGTNPRRPSPAA